MDRETAFSKWWYEEGQHYPDNNLELAKGSWDAAINALFPANETGLERVRGCKKCDGEGYTGPDEYTHNVCTTCNGTGTIRETVSESEAALFAKSLLAVNSEIERCYDTARNVMYYLMPDGSRIELAKEGE